MSFKEKINKVFGIHSPSKAIMGVDLASDIKPIGRLSNGFIIPPLPASIDELHEEKGTKENPIIEEWIWVEGYKGTYSDMTCQGYQYELNKQFDIEPGTKVRECSNGFHLCLKLEDVFRYYPIGGSNKFFKVKALVRKEDYDDYDKCIVSNGAFPGWRKRDKFAAMSIIFTDEVPMNELCEAARKFLGDQEEFAKYIPDEYMQIAFESSVSEACAAYFKDTLMSDGYSEAFSHFIATHRKDRFEMAHMLASMEDLSMDVKVLCIFDNNYTSEAVYAKRRRPR